MSRDYNDDRFVHNWGILSAPNTRVNVYFRKELRAGEENVRVLRATDDQVTIVREFPPNSRETYSYNGDEHVDFELA